MLKITAPRAGDLPNLVVAPALPAPALPGWACPRAAARAAAKKEKKPLVAWPVGRDGVSAEPLRGTCEPDVVSYSTVIRALARSENPYAELERPWTSGIAAIAGAALATASVASSGAAAATGAATGAATDAVTGAAGEGATGASAATATGAAAGSE